MRIYGSSEFIWKDKELYLGKKKTGFSIFNAEEDLYWVKWPDGQISADFYNLTRAKDHCVNLALSVHNRNTKKDTQVAH